ncbi:MULTISPECIES: long-chain fatty acid--CoA ligase [unclassified Ruegeria]|uniref:long-chain fatty acid--CoA ligase n=1 Tax=unclassified Ruegeria TaxID=2625375 RepID=UPI001489C93E|nr:MULTISPECIES: long-chain fatty acid--CoA ligase [unclassified Ruegeria]
MLGKMMMQQLTIGAAIEHAERCHAATEVVGVETDGSKTKSNWGTVARRARQLGSALTKAGLAQGDRVATIAWNNLRHLEIYFGSSGAGFVCHTINPRLFPDQLEYIVAHAQDRILFIDETFVPIVAGMGERLSVVERVIILAPKSDALAAQLPNAEFFDDFLATGDTDFDWPEIDETSTSSLCYTSGTTGNPKGVAYTHRSTMLHSMALMAADGMGLGASEAVLTVVPMFHVNAWGIPYAAAMAGCKLILPGPKLDGSSLLSLILEERATFAAGVPTIWAGLLQALAENTPDDLPLKRTVVGGSACPPSMMDAFRDVFGVEVIHAWGMTETSPLGVINHLTNAQLALTSRQQNKIRVSQGRPPFGVQLRVLNEDGSEASTGGGATGILQIKGHWIVEQYFATDTPATQDGWFDTGDIASIDADGFVTILDRSKDLIKSGGEWISSVELENIAMAHPKIADAAAIAVPHPKWDERPVILVKLVDGAELSEAAVLEMYGHKIAKWQIPDRAIFVDEIPRNATGKIVKTKLRETYAKDVTLA